MFSRPPEPAMGRPSLALCCVNQLILFRFSHLGLIPELRGAVPPRAAGGVKEVRAPRFFPERRSRNLTAPLLKSRSSFCTREPAPDCTCTAPSGPSSRSTLHLLVQQADLLRLCQIFEKTYAVPTGAS
ncbi:unnamed protein product [Prorocentrum cordatum]|uniref:Uncharacterized protein n=1 Tax=Prorocentrum cordatum TaxID=2364126 RepID=A0ABN9SCA0_9DINO|nr:unnamed protein product [Polarella glacialis]